MRTAGPVIIVLVLGSLLSSYAFKTWRVYETEAIKRNFAVAANVRLGELRRNIVRSFDGMAYLRQQTETNAAPDRVARSSGQPRKPIRPGWSCASAFRPGTTCFSGATSPPIPNTAHAWAKACHPRP
jgi:hypothetical protein